MTDTPAPGPSPTPASMLMPGQQPPQQQQHDPQHQHVGNGQPVMANGQPLPAPLASQTERAVRRYASVREGVTPFTAQIEDQVYTFNRKPHVKAQVGLMTMLAHFNEGMDLTAETIEKVNGLVEDLEAALRSMIHAEEEDRIDDLMRRLDIEPLAELAGDVMNHLTTRPTTGSSASSVNPQPTTSTTGYAAQGSPAPTLNS